MFYVLFIRLEFPRSSQKLDTLTSIELTVHVVSRTFLVTTVLTV